MRYKLINPVIKPTKNSTATNKTVYLSCQVFNEDDLFDNPSTLPSVAIFNTAIIAMYAPFILEANGGSAQPNPTTGKAPELPEHLQYFTNAMFVNFSLGGNFTRVYSSDFTDGNGVAHKAGDQILTKSNQPQIYNSVKILCKKTVDNETGERNWAQGWSPEERARSLVSAFFTRVEENIDPSMMPSAPTAAPIPGAPNQPAQTAPTPQF